MPGVQFFGDGPIVIGNHVNIGNNTLLYASKDGGITIGDDTMIAADCYIIDMDHGLKAGVPVRKQQNTVQRVHIGKDALVGAGCTLTKDAPEARIIVGNPGRDVGPVTKIKDEAGNDVYPWRYSFKRGTPWAQSDYDTWIAQNASKEE